MRTPPILPHWVDHPRFNRIDLYGAITYAQRIRLTTPDDVDAELGRWCGSRTNGGSKRT